MILWDIQEALLDVEEVFITQDARMALDEYIVVVVYVVVELDLSLHVHILQDIIVKSIIILSNQRNDFTRINLF